MHFRAYTWRALPWAERRMGKDEGVFEVWLEEPLGAAWTAAFRLMEQGGQVVVGELRVFPTEDGGAVPGRWSAETDRLGVDADVPVGGLTARTLRTVRFDAARHDIRAALAEVRGRPLPPEVRDFLGRFRVYNVERVRRRPAAGRKQQWSDADYARLAARYVEKVTGGSAKPIEELATEDRYSSARIRQALRTARTKGLLTETQRGRPGGTLTPKADLLLQEGDNG